MSDTPRTDAHFNAIYSDCGGIELCRQLERELAAKAEECKRLRKNIYMTEEKLVVIRDSTYRDAVTLRAMAAAVLEALREGK